MKFNFKSFAKNRNLSILFKKYNSKQYNVSYIKKEEFRNKNNSNMKIFLLYIRIYSIVFVEDYTKSKYFVKKKFCFDKNNQMCFPIKLYLLQRLLSSFLTKIFLLIFFFLRKKQFTKINIKLFPVMYFRNFFFRYRNHFLFILKNIT